MVSPPAHDDPTELHSPVFQDGFVDGNGNFTVGGYYSYDRDPNKIFVPVIIKFDSSLNELFQYVSTHQIQIPLSYINVSSMSARIRPCKNDNTFYLLTPTSPLIYSSPVILVDNDGQEVDTAELFPNIADILAENQQEGYLLHPEIIINDFIYHDNRIIETGPIQLSATDLYGNWWRLSNVFGVFSFQFFYMLPFIQMEIKTFEWAYAYDYMKKKYPWMFKQRIPKSFPPIPRPCPECRRSFSADWRPEKTPDNLLDIYESMYHFSNLTDFKFLKILIKPLIKLFKNAEVGARFTESMKKSVLEALEGFKGSKGDLPKLGGKLVETVNAMDLDWRVPPILKKQAKSGSNVTVDFRGVSWITIKDVKRPCEFLLEVKGSLPALTKKLQPGWPIASYNFKVEGELEDQVDISFYIGGITFFGFSSPRILEWDGKSYKDITVRVDYRRRVVTGRTRTLGTFVIMNDVSYAGKLE